jgi:hypothetical protein
LAATGITSDVDFPTTAGVKKIGEEGSHAPSRMSTAEAVANGSQAFITKFNASGSSLIFSTYLGGGTSGEGVSVALDGNGNIYAAGDSDYGNGAGWLAEFDPNGNLLFSSEFGASDFETGSLALGPDGSMYVVGTSPGLS